MARVYRFMRSGSLIALTYLGIGAGFLQAQGVLDNGSNVTGSVAHGQKGTWNFSANQGDDITVSISEIGTNTAFYPMLQLVGPDGTNYGYAWGDLVASRHITGRQTGTYSLIVSHYDPANTVGQYVVTLARSPAAFTVSPGDEGGALQIGGNYDGTLLRGDLDMWRFSANKGDDITASISELGTNTAFFPMLQLIGPDGINYGYAWGDLNASRHITAASTGTYTVVASRYDTADGSGRYRLVVAKSPGTYVTPTGDEGGPISSGMNVSGVIVRGDLDGWTFDANKGDDLTVSISETGTNTAYYPMIQLIGSDGINYGYSWGDWHANRHITAASTGKYTIVVSRYDSSDATGHYSLTMVRSPATFVIPTGDQGGSMTDGQSYSGTIFRGDLDPWSFTANKGDDITVSISESGTDTAYYPMIQIIGPDGINYGYAWGNLNAERHITAGTTGAYTVVVSRYDSSDVTGAYTLTLAKSPGTFVVPGGDQGGALNNGANYTGSILRGDLDEWSFNANAGDDITVSASEFGSNTSFYPMIQIVGPTGTDFGYGWGDLWTSRRITANATGSYTVTVSRYDSSDGSGNYLLTMARSPATFTVPTGDEGGTISLGSTHSGTILRGDLDQWSFNAVKGQVIHVTATETGTNTSFFPLVQVIGPDGTNYGYAWGDVTASRQITAGATGLYKVVVSRYDSADGSGHYSLLVQ